MKNYPLEKYHFYIHTKSDGSIETVAVSTYAGRVVRATAKCDPNDTYSELAGKKLAAARCNVRVAKLRKMNARGKLRAAAAAYQQAKAQYEKMVEYHADACSAYHRANYAAQELEATL